MFRRPSPSLRTALVALLCATTCTWAQAAPDPSDAVAQLLIDRGLLHASVVERPGGNHSTGTLGENVRDATSGLVISAMNFLGVPYRRGGNSFEGFDCSGFTRHIYENSLGLLLPRKVDEQAKASGLASVKRSELMPGDLVFFNTLRRTFSHVGIYVGNDKFIHAPKPGGEVRVENLSVRYWSKRFTGARRAAQSTVVAQAAAVPAPTGPLLSTIPNDNLSP